MVMIYDWSRAGPPAKLTNVQKLQVDQTELVLTENKGTRIMGPRISFEYILVFDVNF